MSKLIKLTNGKYCIVDDEDYEFLIQFNWYFIKDKNTYYAIMNCINDNGRSTTLRMHRLITNAASVKQVDHKNRNGLDNRKINLRICNSTNNHGNAKKYKNGLTSSFKGVSWDDKRKRWRVQIGLNKKAKHIGYFNNEILAAKTYNEAAKIVFGEFACLNIIKK